jgi:hypothetical protein
MKTCSHCGVEKELTEYAVRDKIKGIYRTECRQCIRDRSKKWRDSKPGINRKYYDKQYEKNRFQYCKYCGERYRLISSGGYCSKKCYILGKIQKKENDCWEWKGIINHQGYGKASENDKDITAHRLSYKVFKGEIPDNLLVMHVCDNRKCCNPDHLKLGTSQENTLDMLQKDRWFGGWKKGETGRKFSYSDEQKIKCVILRKEGKTFKQIFEELNLMNPRSARELYKRNKKFLEKYKELLTSGET